MEVDTGRLTEDEQMDEDLSLATSTSASGEGEGESDGDEVMMAEDGEGAERVDDDGDIDVEVYEEYEDGEEMEPEPLPPLSEVGDGGPGGEGEVDPFTPTPTPPIPVMTPTAGAPLVSPFAGVGGGGSPSALTPTGFAFGHPAPQPSPAQPSSSTPQATGSDGVSGGMAPHTPLNASENNSHGIDVSHQPPNDDDHRARGDLASPSLAAGTETSLPPFTDSDSHNAMTTSIAASTLPSTLATVPEPARRGLLDSGASLDPETSSRQPTPAADAEGDGDGVDIGADENEGDEEEFYDDELAEGEDEGLEVELDMDQLDEDADEEYIIDATSLPSIILNLPTVGQRSLFAHPDADEGPVPAGLWLKDRQAELAEASLAEVWAAIRSECIKEGVVQAGGGAIVIKEKQSDLRMNEDDVNLQSITFLELIQLYLDCGLSTPVQLYLTWEPRFITRFNLIQNELEAVKRRRSESAEVEQPSEEVQEQQPAPVKLVQTAATPVSDTAAATTAAVSADSAGTPEPPTRAVAGEPAKKGGAAEGQGEEYDDDEEGYEEYDETASKGEEAFSDCGEDGVQAKERDLGRTPEPTYRQEGSGRGDRDEQRDDRAQYAESVYVKDTKDFEREHPNWAAVRVQPTEPLHFQGEAEQVVSPARGGADDVDGDADDVVDDTIAAGESGEEYDEEERKYDGGDWERGQQDEADTIDESETSNSRPNQERSDMNISTTETEQIAQVPEDEVAKLFRQRAEAGELRRVPVGSELLVPAGTATAAAGAEVEGGDSAEVSLEGEVPADEIALKEEEIDDAAAAAAATEAEAETATGSEALSALPSALPSTGPASGVNTPAEPTSQATESTIPTQQSTLDTIERQKIRRIAHEILAPDTIAEEGEVDSEDVDEREQRVNDAAEEEREPQMLPPPVEGELVGIVPDFKDEYGSNVPDTQPTTPMDEIELLHSTSTSTNDDEATLPADDEETYDLDEEEEYADENGGESESEFPATGDTAEGGSEEIEGDSLPSAATDTSSSSKRSRDGDDDLESKKARVE